MAEHAPVAHRESIIRSTESSEFSCKYDYAMIFKMQGEAGSAKIPNIAKYCIQQMQNSGLETYSYQSVQLDELIVLIRCPVRPMPPLCSLCPHRCSITGGCDEEVCR